jgi:uroporphyrinogen decarboxylase
MVLFASEREIERRVEDILQQAGSRPGHIFNLGHGILPNTPLHGVEVAIECVRRFSTIASSREG